MHYEFVYPYRKPNQPDLLLCVKNEIDLQHLIPLRNKKLSL